MERKTLKEVRTIGDISGYPKEVTMDDLWTYCIRTGIPIQMKIDRVWTHVRLLSFDNVHRQFLVQLLGDNDNSLIYSDYRKWNLVKIPYIKEIVDEIRRQKNAGAEDKF